MSEDNRLRAENKTLRERLSSLTEAVLRISRDLDLEVVLQEVMDSARSLTGARYSAITTLDDAGDLQDFLISGCEPEWERELRVLPYGWELFRYLSGLRETLRTPDWVSHAAVVGFPDFRPFSGALVVMQIRVRGTQVGNIYIAHKEGGGAFTGEDEETLELFAAQAAVAITNARRYGEEQRAKADLEALVNTSPVGVLVFDARTRHVAKVNYEARRIAGAPLAEELDFARHLERLTFLRIDGREIPADELPLERAIRTGESTLAEEIVVRLPGGGEVTTLVNTTPIHDEGGELVSIVTTIQDITPLEELQRLRAEFLGMVSHELRAPLTSIKGSAATARNASLPLDPAETRQFFRIIEEQADHMRDLINNLLDLTRIEAGALSVDLEPTDLAAVVDQAKDAFSSSGHHISIEVGLASDLPRVWADRQRIAQVLYNLFSNASKFSREWSTIKVTASSQDLHVAVCVTDDGIGIAAERLPRLFTKFSHVHADGSQRYGYGLGLAICKGIVEAHGGRMWGDSDGPGHGARFTFTLPAVDPAAVTRPGSEDTASGRAPTKVERILAVDDDPQTLRYIRNTLTEAGYTPILTSDPDQLQRLVEAERPHLVLLNLVLPGTDGFELMRRIPNVLGAPVIILSGRGSDRDVAKAFEMGAADYVIKPFSPTELLARITAALRRRAVSRHAEPYRLGDLTMDFVARVVTVAGHPTKLTPTEYRLLFELCNNEGRVLSYEQLLERVWTGDSSGDPQRVRTVVKDLRRKLGDDARNPTYILTVPGVGYRAATG